MNRAVIRMEELTEKGGVDEYKHKKEAVDDFLDWYEKNRKA